MSLVHYYENEYQGQIAIDEGLGSVFRKPFDRLLAGLSNQYLLDIGCGAGSITAALTGRNLVCGIDASSSACERARSRALRVVRGDCEATLPFADHSFDLAICREVCEHLVAPGQLVAEIHRVLKPTGRLLVTVPNHFSWEKRLRILSGQNLGLSSGFFGPEFDEWNYPHIRFYTWRGFRRLLEQHGFAVVAEHSLYARQPRLIPGRLWARVGRRFPDLGYGQFVMEATPVIRETSSALSSIPERLPSDAGIVGAAAGQ